jgi:Ca2+-binding EF-hand superfamily protein
MMPLLVAGWAVVQPSCVDLQFPNGTKQEQLRVCVTVNGVSPQMPWQGFITRLFKQFDRNDDGFLSKPEASRLFPLPRPDGQVAYPDFAKMDSNNDGKISLHELTEHFRAKGFSPVVVSVKPPSAEQMTLADVMFQQLDQDRDNKLSVLELKQATRLMRRLDENEDSLLDAAELTAIAKNKPALLPSELKQTLFTGEPTSWLSLDWNPNVDLLINSSSTTLRLDTKRLLFPRGIMRIHINDASPTKAFQASKEFYLAQFSETLGNRQTLSREDVESDTNLQVVSALFDAADRNGDDKLSSQEVKDFLALVELGLACQVHLIVQDHGASLFDLADTNSDGKLDLAELSSLVSFNAINREDIPRQYSLELTRGTNNKQFGPVPLPTITTNAVKAKDRIPQGPKWFQAMDRNSDGFVEKGEFRGPPELFRQYDKNNDGRISLQEAGK